MCRAIPRKVISVNNDSALVEDFKGEMKISLLDDKIKVGDYLLVYGNVAIKKITKKEAREIVDDYKDKR